MLTFAFGRFTGPFSVLLASQIGLSNKLVALFAMEVDCRVHIIIVSFHVPACRDFWVRTSYH